MAKVIKQYRYYGENNSKNQPLNEISLETLESGSVFFSEEGLGSITQLGIQSLPGTMFYLNNAKNPTIIGATGIYELDLEGFSEVNSLRFDKTSISIINDIGSAYIIVDALYEVEEE